MFVKSKKHESSVFGKNISKKACNTDKGVIKYHCLIGCNGFSWGGTPSQVLKSQLKTVIKHFYAAVESGDKAAATEAYKAAVKKVDQAAAHGILHKNAVAHKKSQFTLKLNAMA